MKRALRDRLLWVAATDETFERATDAAGRSILWGRCIHCRRKVELRLDGTPIARATLEHIVPRHHGGDERAENLAIACSPCNANKGVRHDCRRVDDPDLQRVIGLLRGRRRERWRTPPPDWDLPPPPPGWSAGAGHDDPHP